MRTLVLCCLPLLALLAVACLTPSNYQPVSPPTATPPDRTDCGQIMGTTFRSEAEEAWFTANCSSWAPETLGRVDQPAPPASAAPPASSAQTSPSSGAAQPPAAGVSQAQPDPNAQRCDDLRGKPYATPDDRQWFIANCLGTGAPVTQDPNSNAPGPEACDQLSSTTDLTAAEQAWFQANCR